MLPGPVVNIIHNAKQVADSFGCSANLLHNQTLNRMELLTRPLQDIMGDLEVTHVTRGYDVTSPCHCT